MERGFSGGWEYAKWASGAADLWYADVSYVTASPYSEGGLSEGHTTALPFPLTSVKNMQISLRDSAFTAFVHEAVGYPVTAIWWGFRNMMSWSYDNAAIWTSITVRGTWH